MDREIDNTECPKKINKPITITGDGVHYFFNLDPLYLVASPPPPALMNSLSPVIIFNEKFFVVDFCLGHPLHGFLFT